MTFTEKKDLPLVVGDRCSRWEESGCRNSGKLIYGIVAEVGDESFAVKWEDSDDLSEYEWQKVLIMGRHLFI